MKRLILGAAAFAAVSASAGEPTALQRSLLAQWIMDLKRWHPEEPSAQGLIWEQIQSFYANPADWVFVTCADGYLEGDPPYPRACFSILPKYGGGR